MRQLLIFTILFIISLSAQAADTACAKIIGNSWLGSFVIKTFPYCEKYQTCFHSAYSTITNDFGDQFTFTLVPLDKTSTSLQTSKHFICKNGQITITDNRTSSITYTCEYGKCMLKYEDGILTAAMLQILG